MRIYTPAEIQADICELEKISEARLLLTNLAPCVRFRELYSVHYSGKALSDHKVVDDLKKKIDDFIRVTAIPGVDLSPSEVEGEEGACVYISDCRDIYSKPFSFFARFEKAEEFDKSNLPPIPDAAVCIMVIINDYERVSLLDRVLN